MPTQEFALDTSGIKRVQIFHASTGGNITILLDKSIVGSISGQEELVAGKEFMLKDGSLLAVRQFNNSYQVLHNGHPLRLMSAADLATAENIAANERAKDVENEIALRQERARFETVIKGKSIEIPLQKVNTARSGVKQIIGYIIIVCGGLLALYAFFSLPYVTLGPFSITGEQVAQNNGFLWLEPTIAVAVIAIAGIQMLLLFESGVTSEKAVMGIILLSLLALIILLVSSFLQPNYPNYARLASSSISSLFTFSPSIGSGFWVYIIAWVVVLVGSIVQIRSLW